MLPIVGVFLISTVRFFYSVEVSSNDNSSLVVNSFVKKDENILYKKIALVVSILNLFISLIVYILFDFSNNQFQFIQEHYNLSFYDIYLGVDGISIYFVLLTTIIMPIALISN